MPLQIEDYEMLIHSDKLFARKFDEQHIDVAEKIRDAILYRSGDVGADKLEC